MERADSQNKAIAAYSNNQANHPVQRRVIATTAIHCSEPRRFAHETRGSPFGPLGLAASDIRHEMTMDCMRVLIAFH